MSSREIGLNYPGVIGLLLSPAQLGAAPACSLPVLWVPPVWGSALGVGFKWGWCSQLLAVKFCFCEYLGQSFILVGG